MWRISRPLLFVAILCSLSSVAPATTEQLRQWIQSNKNTIQSLPRSAQELVETASESDLASTILRIFGFNLDRSSSPSSTTTATQSTTTPKSGVPVSERDVPTSVRPPLSWNTVTPSRATQKWTQNPPSYTTKRAPWYIKDRTPWNNRYKVTPEVMTPVTTEEDITTTVAPTEVYSSTTEKQTPLISHFSTTSKPVNPWARLWTTTGTPRNFVNVSVLQAGSIRSLKDNQMEMVGAITLINDNGMHVLVDTGASSDTERLLHSIGRIINGKINFLIILFTYELAHVEAF
uniref:Metallo-beta-lactamase domain-containing protein n=1 Tax=Acrobeloides nanus TaxID=290746 RepID=A0A914DRB1_9BILA